MNTSDACNISKSLPTLPIFITEICLITLLAPFGFMFNVALVYCIVKSTLFNINLRILLGHLSLLASWYCLTNFVKNIYVVFLLIIEPCYLVTTLYYCKVQELVTILPLVSMLYSLVAIGFERLYATLNYTTYDHNRKIYVSLVSLFMIWSTALGFQLSPLPQIPEGHIPACQNLLVINKNAALTVLLFSLVLEISSVVMFTITSLLDRMKLTKLLINKTQHTLTARFQLSQNIDINKVMLPSALIHMACFIPQNIFAVSAVSGWEMRMETKLQFINFSLLLVTMFTILHPLITFRKNDRLRQQLTNKFPCLRNIISSTKIEPNNNITIPVKDDVVTNMYFQFYEAAWNKK